MRETRNRMTVFLLAAAVMMSAGTTTAMAQSNGNGEPFNGNGNGNGNGAKAYTRLYVENRCYQPVQLTVEAPKGDVPLPAVTARETALVAFYWTRHVEPHRVLRLARAGAPEKRLTVEELKKMSRYEKLAMSDWVVESWFFTTCARERRLTDPAGNTVRKPQQDETVAEYEMLYSSKQGSTDAMDIYIGYPVRVTVNGLLLKTARTDRDGMLRFLMPEKANGTVVLESKYQGSETMVLGKTWLPVRLRKGKAGDEVLVVPRPLAGMEDW